ncbi:MAG: ATP-dependent Clp protease ATP-binding subunit ClpA [Alteromonadaceae bacterium]|nr:ATP-dependent Clp protease ATP-binding subunit ClpA [Alteromonadaceae bacterium]
MLNKDLENSLNLAFRQAKESRHEFMTVEHLLLALLDNPSSIEALNACGADMSKLRTDLLAFIGETTPVIPAGEDERETQPTLGFQRVLQRAVFHVQSSGKSEVNGSNVLVAIFSEQESQAAYFLKKSDISRLDIVNFISHGIAKIESDKPSPFTEEPVHSVEEEPRTIEKFSLNLNEEALKGNIDPLIGRDDELERTLQVLSRRRKNNPIFVGEAGVGKTAIAEGLANLVISDKVPDFLVDATIYSLDLGALLAGTKYRGDFEKRFKSLLKDLENDKNAILFIDEIHTIIGAGAASGGMMDASNLLKPLLSSGKLRCMGSTTYSEYQSVFEKDRALARRFQKIDIVEPSVEDTTKILHGLKEKYESHHGIRYSNKALRAAAQLSAKYINERFLPDKAIDVIDEAGAKQQLVAISKRKKVINDVDIENIVAKMARIPEKSVSSSEKDSLKTLERNLRLVVFGQDEGIEELCSVIRLSRAGLSNEKKPIGSFLFAGPTGVGKTEVTQQLAKILGVELLRFDMSEYMEKHAVSRLIGAPPGYVGYEQGGLLTDAVLKHPYAVVLLDEIEKAHQDVYNILLQVMDHGTLTDNNGRKADFRNIILVLTTNAGASETARQSIGFKQQDHSLNGKEAINKVFSPEFRNRLDNIVWFNHLDTDVIQLVVDKFIVELQALLDEKGVSLELTHEAKQWLVQHGYDKNMGARPMARLIQEHLKKPLANELLFGELTHGGVVKVEVNKDKLKLIYEKKAELVEQ